ncbi:DUF2461 domain-containing protein [bacterium SCSIO 12741]|nr:DUF2461 domain-containing protein [bacterium SCSIO 12741]
MAQNALFSPDYLQFFKELAANNHKGWFDENRKRYEKEVKKPFQQFIQALIDRVKEDDKEVEIEPKDAIFRINRDIRFSKDKTPYKLNMSGIVSPGGRKNKEAPGLYVEAGPEHFRIYGGVYMLDKNNLEDLRFHIAAQGRKFEQLINDKTFVSHYGEIRGEKAKRLPKELKEAAEKQPLIYNKNFYYFAELPPETVIAENVVDQVMEYYHAGKDLMYFFRQVIHY